MEQQTDDFNLDFLEESNNKFLEDIVITKKTVDKEYLPVAYKIYRCGIGLLEKQPVDTYTVKNGYFEMAKGLAIKKAKLIGGCIVVEIVNKLFKNECGSIIKEVERTVYEASKQMLQSSTIMYKSGHKRRRAKNL